MAHTVKITFEAGATQAQKDAIINAYAVDNDTVVDETTLAEHLCNLVTGFVHKKEKNAHAAQYSPTDLTV